MSNQWVYPKEGKPLWEWQPDGSDQAAMFYDPWPPGFPPMSDSDWKVLFSEPNPHKKYMSEETKPVMRCTWCCCDTGEDEDGDCVRCGNHTLVDRAKPHMPHWSRKTIDTVECKVCDRSGPHSIQASPDLCQPHKNNMPITMTPALVQGFPKFVLDREGKLKGTVTSTSRRCQMEGCNGRRLGVRWPDGKITYPCTKGLAAVPDQVDTWQIM